MQNLDRFKFRWFDKNLGIMADVESLCLSGDYAVVKYSFSDKYTPDEEVNISDGILMQCTGLKDKNGVLIYEGDIVKSWIGGACSRGEIAYKNNTLKCIDFEFESQSINGDENHYKVVGNIYENLKLKERLQKAYKRLEGLERLRIKNY
jgi:hypothetical protein